jgi:hypothetical protein
MQNCIITAAGRVILGAIRAITEIDGAIEAETYLEFKVFATIANVTKDML